MNRLIFAVAASILLCGIDLREIQSAEDMYDKSMLLYDQDKEKEALELLEKAIKKEPNHRACRWALGYRKHKGEWLSSQQAKEKGLVLCKGEWVTQEEFEKAKKEWQEQLNKITQSSGGKGGSAGSFKKEVDASGDTRPYRLMVPKNYDPKKPTPLLLWLHGDGGGMDSYNDVLKPVLEKEGFIVVSPESKRGTMWKLCKGSGYDYGKTDDDDYVVKCVEQTCTEYNVDRYRIYVAGQSKGATYTAKLARQWGNYFAAGGMINGVVSSGYGTPSFRHAPFFVWFGTKDYLHKKYGLRVHILKQEGHETEFIYKEGAGHGAPRESIQAMWDCFKKVSLDKESGGSTENK